MSNLHDRAQSPTLRLALLITFVVVLVLSVASLVALTLTTTSSDSGSPVARVGQVFSGENEVQEERDEVMALAEQFMLRTGTYGPDLLDDQDAMPEYRERVLDVITPKFATSFEKEASTAEQLVAQAGVSREAEVYSTGVSVIDPDSATVLVAGIFTQSVPQGGNSDKRVEQEPVQFRMTVSLVRTDGEWLVDDFAPVTEAQE